MVGTNAVHEVNRREAKPMPEECNFSKLSDEALVERVQQGDQEAQSFLLNKYKSLVRGKSRAYFLIGADREDIIQEGMIGLYKAVRDYSSDKNTTLRSFAELCVNRQMITAIKAATRQKHQPLNSYISLNRPVYEEDSERTYLDVLQGNNSDSTMDPETLLIGRENRSVLESMIAEDLSDFERCVLQYYLQGKSYFEIAQYTNKPEKSIDNALQRVKKKIEKFLEKSVDR